MDREILREELAEHRERWKIALHGLVWIEILQLACLAAILWRIW